MKTFYVEVTKSYVNRSGDRIATVFGSMPIEAKSEKAAIKAVNDLMYPADPCLSTIDPRIQWDEECQRGEYEDWSFETTGEVREDAEEVRV